MQNAVVAVLTGTLGLFFATNIGALNNRERSVNMHKDLPPSASPAAANTKVVITFLCGIGFILAAFGLHWSFSPFLIAGALGAALFVLFYIVEIALWGRSHRTVWLGFFTFGTATLVAGLNCAMIAISL